MGKSYSTRGKNQRGIGLDKPARLPAFGMASGGAQEVQ